LSCVCVYVTWLPVLVQTVFPTRLGVLTCHMEPCQTYTFFVVSKQSNIMIYKYAQDGNWTKVNKLTMQALTIISYSSCITECELYLLIKS